MLVLYIIVVDKYLIMFTANDSVVSPVSQQQRQLAASEAAIRMHNFCFQALAALCIEVVKTVWCVSVNVLRGNDADEECGPM